MTGIESPCTSVCKMDPDTDYCLGCWRTREEIKVWKESGDDVRMDIIKRLHERREAAGLGRRRRKSRRRA